MGKATAQPRGPPAYRDDLDHAETTSMASAVLLNDVEAAFPDEELPSYTDTPSQSSVTPSISRSADGDNHYVYYEYVLTSSDS
jgi:hypothetical protein